MVDGGITMESGIRAPCMIFFLEVSVYKGGSHTTLFTGKEETR